MKLILEKVYIEGREVKAITLKSDYHFALGIMQKSQHY